MCFLYTGSSYILKYAFQICDVNFKVGMQIENNNRHPVLCGRRAMCGCAVEQNNG